jgi:hypothetical protein
LQGVQGRQGLQGDQGIQGLQGRQGLQGTQGVGSQGTQGTQGLQGSQGTGSQGTQGLQGTQGNQGVGSQGTQGLQGLQATQGTQGLQGTQGIQGLQATQGTQGVSGPVAGSANQVIYKNASNVATGNANFLFLDDSTLIVGAATSTSTASQKLQITGGGYVSGNVGVGVAAPSFAMDVSGDARIQSTGKMRFGGTAGTTNFYIQYNSTTNSLDFVAG